MILDRDTAIAWHKGEITREQAMVVWQAEIDAAKKSKHATGAGKAIPSDCRGVEARYRDAHHAMMSQGSNDLALMVSATDALLKRMTGWSRCAKTTRMRRMLAWWDAERLWGQRRIDVVYTLGTGSKYGDDLELRLSIRSWLKYFWQWLGRIWIVGEKPDWLCPCDTVRHVPAGDPYKGNKDANLFSKLRLAADIPEVSGPFIWCSDDQLLMRKATPGDIRSYYSFDLLDAPAYLNGRGRWRARLRRTVRVLREKGFSAFHFDAHVPMPLRKEDILRVTDEWPVYEKPGYTVNTLIGNVCGWEGVPIRGHKLTLKSRSYSVKKAATLSAARYLFLGYTDRGFTPELAESLLTLFPDSCKAETGPPALPWKAGKTSGNALDSEESSRVPTESVSVIIPLMDLGKSPRRLRSFKWVLSQVVKAAPGEILLAESLTDKAHSALPTELPTGVHALSLPAGLNKAQVMNRAAREASGPLLWFLDADVWCPFADILDDLTDQVEEGAVIKAVWPCPVILRLGEKASLDFMKGEPVSAAASQSSSRVFGGGSTIVDKDSFLASGGYCEDISGWGPEDVEFGERFRRFFPVDRMEFQGVHLFHPRNRRTQLKQAKAAWTDIVEPRRDMSTEQLAKETGSMNQMNKASSTDLQVVCVLKTGGEYTVQHVDRLHGMLRKRLKTPFNFVCLTDTPDAVAGGGALQDPNEEGWWTKLELFRGDLFDPEAPVLYLDLDVELPRTFEVNLPAGRQLRMLPSFTAPGGWMSGVMLWRGDYSHIHTFYREHRKTVKFYARGRGGGDQQHIALCCLHRKDPIGSVTGVLDVGHWLPRQKRSNRPFHEVDVLSFWGHVRPWTPGIPSTTPMPPESTEDLWVIIAVFGDSPVHRQAAEKAISHLQERIDVSRALLVEAGRAGTRLDGWKGHRLFVETGPEHDDIFHKEALYNLGVKHITEKHREASGFVFLDADVYPMEPGGKWLERVKAGLRQWPVFQPWRTCIDEGPDGEKEVFTSFGLQKHEGGHSISSGQGFALAVRRSWLERAGGWCDTMISGGGDAVAMLRWDSKKEHATNAMNTFACMRQMVEEYDGPTFDIKSTEGTLRHVWHGARRGPGNTRSYWIRHFVWDWIGGRSEVCERCSRTGLWRWKATKKAEAVRRVRARLKEASNSEELKVIWKQELGEDPLQR